MYGSVASNTLTLDLTVSNVELDITVLAEDTTVKTQQQEQPIQNASIKDYSTIKQAKDNNTTPFAITNHVNITDSTEFRRQYDKADERSKDYSSGGIIKTSKPYIVSDSSEESEFIPGKDSAVQFGKHGTITVEGPAEYDATLEEDGCSHNTEDDGKKGGRYP